jgi:hypothetical protein
MHFRFTVEEVFISLYDFILDNYAYSFNMFNFIKYFCMTSVSLFYVFLCCDLACCCMWVLSPTVMVFKNRVLREIFGPEWEEVAGDCKKLLSEEVNDLYCSPNVVTVISEDQLGGTCRTLGENLNACRFWWGNLKERDYLENLVIDGRVIVKYILKKWDGRVLTGLIWLRIGPSCGLL